MSVPLQQLVAFFSLGRYNITKHGFDEMGNDGVTTAYLESVIVDDQPDVIEDYPTDIRGPCCLVLAWDTIGQPLHTVIGYGGALPSVITVYRPSATRWESDFRTRRYRYYGTP